MKNEIHSNMFYATAVPSKELKAAKEYLSVLSIVLEMIIELADYCPEEEECEYTVQEETIIIAESDGTYLLPTSAKL
jgi:hypothetical protein